MGFRSRASTRRWRRHGLTTAVVGGLYLSKPSGGMRRAWVRGHALRALTGTGTRCTACPR